VAGIPIMADVASTSAPALALKKTALHAAHVALGARMVPFGGWDMPVEYSGITAEHLAVRERVGLFDVSHMGEVEIAGADALAAVQKITSNDASKLAVGQIQYSSLPTPEGTVVDDVLVYRWASEHFLLVINAGNIAKDVAWIREQIAGVGDAVMVDSSSRYALIAVQGPRAQDVLQPLTGVDLAGLKYYWFAHGEFAGIRGTVSRTGYTGEDGFEIFVPPGQAERLWKALLDAGQSVGIVPAGLGARDTLRLEASMRLCGSDMDETTTLLEAGLGWIVGWKKADFIGKAALDAQKASGLTRKLVGFEMTDRGIARAGCPVLIDGAVAGRVTSGTQTPYLKRAIGMAYVPATASAPGQALEIDIRGRKVAAKVVPMPFYKRATS
jgi:aminomethyltransferase